MLIVVVVVSIRLGVVICVIRLLSVGLCMLCCCVILIVIYVVGVWLL